MITQLKPRTQTLWQQELRDLITCPIKLLKQLNLTIEQVPFAVDTKFPLRAPKSFVKKIRPKDPNDPLLRQILTSPKESLITKGYCQDPLQESNYNPVKGLLHKFSSRALVTLTGSCAIHCRYCFRRHFNYSDNQCSKKNWPNIVEYIAANPDIFEIVLSGGDPLMAKDNFIKDFITCLRELPQIKIIRFHTRLPVVIPTRITPELISAITNHNLKIIMVYHINHANEICANIAAGARLLQQNNIPVLNQSVLLKGINDSVDSLVQLNKSLFESNIIPYYLHLLDPVQGTDHFAISDAEAKHLYSQVQNSLPGYMLPKMVREVPGKQAKQIII